MNCCYWAEKTIPKNNAIQAVPQKATASKAEAAEGGPEFSLSEEKEAAKKQPLSK